MDITLSILIQFDDTEFFLDHYFISIADYSNVHWGFHPPVPIYVSSISFYVLYIYMYKFTG